jgi:phenylacetate-CoA ligase
LNQSLSQIASPRILITSAEVLDTPTREALELDLNLELFNFYASMETGRIAFECTAHAGLHLNADQVILECLSKADSGDGTSGGEVVITCLQAFAMPFIRYRLGDITTLRTEPCPCGSCFPLIDPPAGRRERLIQLPSGERISFYGFFQILRQYFWIRQFRVIQHAPDHILVLMTYYETPGQEELATIRERLLNYAREPIRLDTELVKELPDRGPKFGSFQSKLG